MSTPYGDIPVGPVADDVLVVPRGRPALGDLLVAGLALTESTFTRSVVLLLDHNEDGSLGVVLTTPTELDVDAILPAWSPLVTGPPVVFQGGPVALDSALALADVAGPDDVSGFRRVVGALGLVDLDGEPDVLAPRARSFRVFAGYAGWGPGQLDDEIREGSWYVVPSIPGDAFDSDAATLWSRVLHRQGGDGVLIASAPEDPSLN